MTPSSTSKKNKQHGSKRISYCVVILYDIVAADLCIELLKGHRTLGWIKYKFQTLHTQVQPSLIQEVNSAKYNSEFPYTHSNP